MLLVYLIAEYLVPLRFPFNFRIQKSVACILNSDYGLKTSWDEASVVSDIPVQSRYFLKNEIGYPDALMRVRCPVANFSEKHTVDRGEDAPAMRAVSSLPIPAASTLVLKPSENHVMLLQVREPLAVGGRFNCALVFQKAGAIETEVEVRRKP